MFAPMTATRAERRSSSAVYTRPMRMSRGEMIAMLAVEPAKKKLSVS